MTPPAPDWLPPGYSPIRLIGQGGMGEVWLATAAGGETRAVKRMKLSSGAGADRLRFKREFRVLARLTHPGIVRAFDFHESADSLAYAMEFVAGWELREYFTGGHWHEAGADPRFHLQRAALDRLWDIAAVLLETLGALHADGIVHRDLKPANILIGPDHRARLIDFGLARPEVETDQQVTGAGEVMGTPLYLSPEQIRAQPLDGRSDLYALGVILYEFAAGRHPFPVEGIGPLLTAHLQQSPAPPGSLNPALRAGDSAFILRLLAKEPGGRFPTAWAAQEALRRLRAAAGSALAATLLLHPEAVLPPGGLLQTPWIGNDAAFQNLRDAAAQLAGGRGGVRLVEAAAGAGKSRLLDELRMQAQGRRIHIWRAAGQASGGALGQLFQDFFAAAAHEAAARPGQIGSWLGRQGPILAHYFPVLRFHAAGEEHVPIEGAAEEARLMGAVYELFDRLLGTEKILLLVDDLHLADPLSRKLLAHLALSFTGVSAAAPAARPLLIAAAQRGAEGPAKALSKTLTAGAEPLRLQPLTSAETGQLAQASLGLVDSPDEPLARRLHEITGGNPFFILELLRQGLDEGRLATPDGRPDLERWLTLMQSGTLRLPATVEEAVRARLQGLTEGDRQALQLAAVIGPRFQFAWWKALAASGEDELLDAADRAIRAGLLEEAGREFLRFPHGLTRLELESEVSGLRRRRLHRKLVDILAGAGDEHRMALAEHAIDSGEPELAARHAIPVITSLTRESGQYLEAKRLLERMMRCFTEDPPLPSAARVSFWINRASVEIATDKLPVGIEYSRKAVALAEADGDPLLRFDSLQGLLNQLITLGKFSEAESDAHGLLTLAEELRDPRRTGQALLITANIKLTTGDWLESVRQHERVAELCAGEALWDIRSKAFNNTAVAWAIGGDLGKTRGYLQAALELARRHGNFNNLSLYQANFSELEWNDGALAAARERALDALEAARKSGNQPALCLAQVNLGQILGEGGDCAEAGDRIAAALAIAAETASLRLEVNARISQGQHLLACGGANPEGAGLEHAARKYGAAGRLLESLANACRLALRRGERQAAVSLAEEIIGSTKDKNPRERAIARALLAGLAGDEPGVRTALEAADAEKSVPTAFYARLTGAEALIAADRLAAARQILDELEPRAREKAFLGTQRQISMLREKIRAADCMSAARDSTM